LYDSNPSSSAEGLFRERVECMTSFREITRENFDAVLFDLDGVLTATAKLHAAAWKQTFDGFLKQRAEAQREAA
jgi:hypothetical protein